MENMSLLLTMGSLLLAVGAFAGLLAGLLGVGGGIILVPAFFYVFGMLGYDSPQLMQLCLGTSLATIIITSLRSVLAHNRKGAVDWQILRGWAIGIAFGALAGVFVAASLRSATLQFTFGVMAVFVGCYLALGQSSWRLGDRMPVGVRRAVISPLIGLLSVLMGIGGGAFGVSIMTLHGVPIHRAVATAAGLGVLIAVPSVAGFLTVSVDNAPPWTFGAVNLVAAGLVVAMTLITAPLGAALAHKTNPFVLKRIFGLFLILVALNMLRKAAGW
ncbi:sulfite exporter TauE/SafE family protein [Yoonia sediminilitoris]|uniref:Probable membrane transporter protein n=1 Tax=Yoonia sediminilitoris TaxID=1286148 RepID=A0A2T6KE08_9RHOB|nr:sulfite exporter TauE/SafE family protein [Yoonia sediminilitoris]PUB13266.1 putative membrane protein YfcA [Yoonia sediminilitoris]RCW94601.1 putative membrane protein YfcA [Yoonia sediminilitoris]